jgi:outer membrane receptor protein involved in Fe transport
LIHTRRRRDHPGHYIQRFACLAASYRLSDNILLYAAIDNVGNVTPPAIPSTGGNNGTNQAVYDALGRAIRLGVGFSN